MVAAAIAGEDGKFCTHDGFDRVAIEKAIERKPDGSRIRGGSTISQQTAKNVFLWQGTAGAISARGWRPGSRCLIENSWGKRRIMEVYLNCWPAGVSLEPASPPHARIVTALSAKSHRPPIRPVA